MKFQKTLLAASLALLATGANAATYDANDVAKKSVQEANKLTSAEVEADPVQKKENLEKVYRDILGNLNIETGDVQTAVYDAAGNLLTEVDNHRFVWAPVVGAWDKNVNAKQYPTAQYTNFADGSAGLVNHNNIQDTIIEVRDANGDLKHFNLGSKVLAGAGVGGNALDFDVFKYTALGSPTTEVYQFENPVTHEKTGFFTKDAQGNLQPFTGEVDVNTLAKGGKVKGATGSTSSTGIENKVINSEHVLYGYQGQTITGNDVVNGRLIKEDGTEGEDINGTLKQGTVNNTNVKYVQQGIIANEYYKGQKDADGDWIYDPANNIYGVAARNGNNVVQLTGDGIALADLKNNGKLQFDGSVVSNAKSVDTRHSGVQKTRQYDVAGETYVEIYNDDVGRELDSQWFKLEGSNLVRAEAPQVAPGSHIKTGVGVYNDGVWEVATNHNTVTSQKVRYGEEVSHQDKTTVEVGVTINNAAADTSLAGDFANGAATSVTKQYVDTGILDNNLGVISSLGTNNYGVQVYHKAVDGAEKYATLTANGLKTNGVVDAKEFFLDGKKIDFTDLSVGGGEGGEGGVVVGGVTAEQVDEKVSASAEATLTEAKTYTDTKVEGAIKNASTELTAAAVTAATEKVDGIVKESAEKTLASANAYTDGKFNQVNKRLDDVEKTANRGVAIALAAQQAVPNVQPGQVAVFGGVGHYEGETAVSLGAVTSFTDRVSASGAFGFSEGSTFGGRVGVSYLFGGK